MIDVSGHLRDIRKEIGFEDFTQPVIVNCCGYQIFKTKDFFRQRFNGRLDYQIIYIYRGCGHFKINGCWDTYNAGNIILYAPFEPQIYTYYAKDKPEVCWIHFTGSDSAELVKRHQITNCNIGENLQIKNLFLDIILELQLKKPLFEEIANSSLLKLLALIQRTSLLQTAFTEFNFAIDRLIINLNLHYMDPWSISSMAEYCNLSCDYFSHTFKYVIGTSPMQYLTNLRIEKAKELLCTERVSVTAVAALVGYEDPLYFSRVFKRVTGCPPKIFHENSLLRNTPSG